MSNNIASPYPHVNLTTEQIQQYLDMNNKLILAILETHNSGRYAEKALYMDQLETNLKFLTILADEAAQAEASSSQFSFQPYLPEVQQFLEHSPAIPRGSTSVQQTPQFISGLPFQELQHRQPVNLQEQEFIRKLRGAPKTNYEASSEAGPSNFLGMSTYGYSKGNMGS